MPSRSEYDRATASYGYKYFRRQLSYTWNRSPRDANGKLLLQANAMYRDEKNVLRLTQGGRHPLNTQRQAIYGQTRLFGSPQSIDPAMTASVKNRAYARLVSTIRGESSAALGMTLSSWKQSLEMIGTRADQIRKIALHAHRKAARQPRKSRRRKLRGKDLLPVTSANIFLEGIFGWLPLYEDLVNTMKVLAGDLPGGFVKGSSQELKSLVPQSNSTIKASGITLHCRVVQTAFVRVDNPNVWLLNKLGLINPGQVLWDKVPWSFIVNEFVNLNAIMESYTSFAGLTLSNASTTTKWRYVEISSLATPGVPPGSYEYMTESRSFNDTVKHRVTGLALPQLEFRLPQLNLTGALIKVSLMVQQVSRLK